MKYLMKGFVALGLILLPLTVAAEHHEDAVADAGTEAEAAADGAVADEGAAAAEAAEEVVDDSMGGTLQRAASKGADTAAQEALKGADMGTVGKKGAASAVDEALGVPGIGGAALGK